MREDRQAVMARAALSGAGGGVLLAWADLMATVMWLPDVADRVGLALRLLSLLPGVGALAATLVVWLDRAARPRLARLPVPLRFAAPLPLMVALSPALLALVLAVFTGARISSVPFLPLVMSMVGAGLTVALYFGLRAARLLARRGPSASPGRRTLLALALLAAVVGLTQCDRLLYPRHYEAIHGALSVVAWALASLAVFVASPRALGQRLRPRPIAALAGLATVVALSSLPADHDGRAALMSPRASNARSLLLATSPVLFAWQRVEASDRAIAHAQEAQRRRDAGAASGDLPTWSGAHVVVVTVDALRADHLGLYGYGRDISPTLDALASRAVVFERAWTATPRSSYSLCSLMTGLALQPRLEADEATSPSTTLAASLSQAGLHTAAFYPEGIFFHDGARLGHYRRGELGFSRRDAENHDAESLTDAVLAEIDDLVARGEPQSFLWVHYFDVHEPYRERALGDTPLDRYDGEIRNVDRALARLLAGMQRLRREVVLVVSADHGEEHGDHGGSFHGDSLYEEQLRVPLIVAAPGLSARRVPGPVSLLDVAPTLLAMLGEPAWADLDGADLRASLVGRELARGPVVATERGMRAAVDWPYKLIDDARVGTLELFDLASDPSERRNLATDRPELVDALRAELEVARLSR